MSSWVLLSPAERAALAELVARRGAVADDRPAAVQERPAYLLASITGVDLSGDGPAYSWSALDDQPGGVLVSDGTALVGSADYYPAYELNDSPDVLIGAVVKLWPARGGEYFWFDAGALVAATGPGGSHGEHTGWVRIASTKKTGPAGQTAYFYSGGAYQFPGAARVGVVEDAAVWVRPPNDERLLVDRYYFAKRQDRFDPNPSSSGSGSGPIDDCIANGTCTECGDLNDTFTLTPNAAHDWRLTGGTLCGDTRILQVASSGPGTDYEFKVTNGSGFDAAIYVAAGSSGWDEASPLVAELSIDTGRCTNLPASVTITPTGGNMVVTLGCAAGGATVTVDCGGGVTHQVPRLLPIETTNFLTITWNGGANQQEIPPFSGTLTYGATAGIGGVPGWGGLTVDDLDGHTWNVSLVFIGCSPSLSFELPGATSISYGFVAADVTWGPPFSITLDHAFQTGGPLGGLIGTAAAVGGARYVWVTQEVCCLPSSVQSIGSHHQSDPPGSIPSHPPPSGGPTPCGYASTLYAHIQAFVTPGEGTDFMAAIDGMTVTCTYDNSNGLWGGTDNAAYAGDAQVPAQPIYATFFFGCNSLPPTLCPDAGPYAAPFENGSMGGLVPQAVIKSFSGTVCNVMLVSFSANPLVLVLRVYTTVNSYWKVTITE